MAPVLIVVGGILLSAVVLGLINYYGDRRTMAWYVVVTVFIGWMVPFSIVFLLPLDISSTFYYRCSTPPVNHTLSNSTTPDTTTWDPQCDIPFTLVPREFYYYAWKVMYWITFVFTWAIFPLMQSYVEAGEFHFWGKLKTSLKSNLIFYAISGVVGIVFLLYVRIAGNMEWTNIFSLCMMAANAWGLLLIVVFLGYGLVDVPRQLWYNADRRLSLRYHEFRASNLKESLAEAEVQLFNLAKVIATINIEIRMNDPIRPLVDKLVHKCPYSTDRNIAISGSDSSELPEEIDEKYLAKLHLKLKKIIRDRDRRECQWRDLLTEAYTLQDIIKNESNTTMRFESTVRNYADSQLKDLRQFWDWLWLVYLQPVAMRILAIIFILMTLALIWSEITFLSEKPVLSILAIIIHQPTLNSFSIEFLSLVAVFYMCLCTYSSLFKVRIFNLYYLEPKHLTDESSLIFSASYLCRLTFPLCYNFMNLIQEHTDTQFSVVLGDVHSIPIFSSVDVYKFLPFAIVVLCFLTLFNVYGRILRCFNVKMFLQDDEDLLEDETGEGKQLIEQARKAEERSLRNILQTDDSNESLNQIAENARRKTRGRHTAVATEDGEEPDFATTGRAHRKTKASAADADAAASKNATASSKSFRPGFFWRREKPSATQGTEALLSDEENLDAFARADDDDDDYSSRNNAGVRFGNRTATSSSILDNKSKRSLDRANDADVDDDDDSDLFGGRRSQQQSALPSQQVKMSRLTPSPDYHASSASSSSFSRPSGSRVFGTNSTAPSSAGAQNQKGSAAKKSMFGFGQGGANRDSYFDDV